MAERRSPLPRGAVGTGIKLLLASLAVGLGLSVLGVSARDVLGWVSGTLGDAVGVGASVLDWAWGYVILGAAVVVPVWLVVVAVGHFKKR